MSCMLKRMYLEKDYSELKKSYFSLRRNTLCTFVRDRNDADTTRHGAPAPKRPTFTASPRHPSRLRTLPRIGHLSHPIRIISSQHSSPISPKTHRISTNPPILARKGHNLRASINQTLQSLLYSALQFSRFLIIKTERNAILALVSFLEKFSYYNTNSGIERTTPRRHNLGKSFSCWNPNSGIEICSDNTTPICFALDMEKPTTKVRFGILGCAAIARKLVRAMLLMPEQVEITAVGSRSLAKAQEFAATEHLPAETRLYGSYEAVLDDPEVDAVYIPLPAGLHVEWVVKAAQKKKHVLLEKPVAPSVEELDAFLAVVEANQVQFMDGTMFMHHPRAAEVFQVLHDTHVIGELREVIAVFITDLAVKEGWTSDVRGQTHLDGLGALGDIGWYCARVILWAFDGQLPHSVTAHAGSKLSHTGVLTSCGATFEWTDGRLATFRCSFLGDMVMKAICSGTKGSVEVDDFVIPKQEHLSSYRVKQAATWEDRSTGWGTTEEVRHVTTALPQEALMVQEFAKLVANLKNGSGVVDPKWAALARKTQVLLNAVKTSIESNCHTISLSKNGGL